MRRLTGLCTIALAMACGGGALPVPAPVPDRAGCYVLDAEATAAPFLFPDTLELAAEWFLPQDSTGGRLRVVQPRDAALATYRTFGGRFWWESLEDSVLVTRSDGVSGVVLAIPATAAEFTAAIRTFGPGYGVMEYVSGRRFPCRGPS
jgi:hypothetical protein